MASYLRYKGPAPVSSGTAPVVLTSLTQAIDENEPLSLTVETDIPANITVRSGDAAALFDVGEDDTGALSLDFEALPSQAVGNTLVLPLRAASVDTPTAFTDFSITFTIGNVTEDTTPQGFSFVDEPEALVSAVVESNTITVAGVDGPTDISVSGGEYSVNGGAYTSTSGTVVAGDTVKVRHTASASNSTPTNTVLTIGGISDTFTTITVPAPAGPPLTGDEADGTNILSASTVYIGASETLNAILAPDDTATATRVTEDSNANRHIGYRRFSAAANTTRRMSVYVKPNGRRYIQLGLNGASVFFDTTTFKVTDSAITGTQSNLVTYVENAANGFAKYTVQLFDTAAVTDGFAIYGLSNRVSLAPGENSNGNPFYTGDGTSGQYWWRLKMVVT